MAEDLQVIRLETGQVKAMNNQSGPGLYREAYEKDSCGFGLIANLDDQASHWLVRTAIASLNRLSHRGAIAADGKTGDGYHARSALGFAALPTAAAVEVEAIFEIKS